jgi:hypothetical protein
MMARIFSGMVMNNTQPIPADLLPDDWHFHFLHCVDYMRQSVMCSADLAIEPHEPDEADVTGPLDGGWNGHHGKFTPVTLARGLTSEQSARTMDR